MTTRSSTAGRLLACLLTLVLVGAGTAGVATAATPVNESSTPETDADSLEEAVNGTTDTIEETTNATTDSLETTNDTTETLNETVDGTTDDLETTTDEPTVGLDGVTAETPDMLGETVDGTTATVNDTADTAEETTNATAGGLEGDFETSIRIGEPGAGLEASAGVSTSEGSDGANASKTGAADGGAHGLPASGTSPATDAVLVGLLGAITASGAAATGAGAGAGAGASAGSAGAAGGVAGLSGLLANWLGQSRGPRWLRRIGSLLPWELVPIFKYSRYDDSDPLENDRRQAIYETIAADPGCYLSQVSDDSGVALSTVRHHVRVLEDEGLVTSAKLNGKRRYYLEADAADAPSGGDDSADTALHAALAEPAKREVLEALAALESAPNGRLADELERDPSTVSHHLRALADDGLVVRTRDGRSMRNALAPEVVAALGVDEQALEDDSSGTVTMLADD
ncbi:winged helix-turn-helix transcriptional regulator [Natronorubrum aibiense]|uniref:Helix-turn-helix domain-containing protein n=1 Tax=Natronorubrum aibiense TaxID=348826 RepID=A0A5P9P769_9EURY|nr:helix-turn-helix domain-containing protein [Natronorubrum aibiense]QFU84031.1 helix-turn-helix domain-containing protein [Natronorubrum aibiense]